MRLTNDEIYEKIYNCIDEAGEEVEEETVAVIDGIDLEIGRMKRRGAKGVQAAMRDMGRTDYDITKATKIAEFVIDAIFVECLGDAEEQTEVYKEIINA